MLDGEESEDIMTQEKLSKVLENHKNWLNEYSYKESDGYDD